MTAESPASGARFVGLLLTKTPAAKRRQSRFYTDFDFDQSPKTLCEPERLQKNGLSANQNAKRKRLLERRNFTQTKMHAEKGKLIFLPKPLPGKDKPILETQQNQPRTKPKPRNKANQNHREPKHKRKILKPT
jgi:hypothetical protein